MFYFLLCSKHLAKLMENDFIFREDVLSSPHPFKIRSEIVCSDYYSSWLQWQPSKVTWIQKAGYLEVPILLGFWICGKTVNSYRNEGQHANFSCSDGVKTFAKFTGIERMKFFPLITLDLCAHFIFIWEFTCVILLGMEMKIRNPLIYNHCWQKLNILED